MKYADGREFRGAYVLGEMKHGYMTFPDGGRYAGDYRSGPPHGNGTMSFHDGSKYEGRFREGKQWGKGIMYLPDGGVYEGDFCRGIVNGFGKELRPDGTVRHVGLFRNGKPVRNQGVERWK